MDVGMLYSLSLFAYAIALAPAVAHLAQMRHKMSLSVDEYFEAQRLYNSWAWFGLAEIAAIAATSLLTVETAGTARFAPALTAAVAAAAALAVFFVRVLPANRATMDWNTVTEHWERERRRWESGHAVRCVLFLVGLVALLVAG